MFNYIMADMSRIGKKKGFVITNLIYVGLFILMIFIANNPSFTSTNYISTVNMYLGFAPLFIGLSIYLSIYYDDFKSKAMQVAIGYGISRNKIIIFKIIEALILTFISVLFIGIITLVSPYIIKMNLSQAENYQILKNIITETLKILGYIIITLPFIYSKQNPINGTIIYVLFASKFMIVSASIILSQKFIVNLFGNLNEYLLTNTLAILLDGSIKLSLIITLGVYFIVPIILALILFKNKELEF